MRWRLASAASVGFPFRLGSEARPMSPSDESDGFGRQVRGKFDESSMIPESSWRITAVYRTSTTDRPAHRVPRLHRFERRP